MRSSHDSLGPRVWGFTFGTNRSGDGGQDLDPTAEAYKGSFLLVRRDDGTVNIVYEGDTMQGYLDDFLEELQDCVSLEPTSETKIWWPGRSECPDVGFDSQLRALSSSGLRVDLERGMVCGPWSAACDTDAHKAGTRSGLAYFDHIVVEIILAMGSGIVGNATYDGLKTTFAYIAKRLKARGHPVRPSGEWPTPGDRRHQDWRNDSSYL